VPKYLLALFACAVSVLALAACGGDSESDEEKIANAIETSVTTTDPDDCEVYATQAFLEQSEGERGEAAVASCEEDVEDTSNDPDSVTVSKVDVGDEAATAEVAFRGGGSTSRPWSSPWSRKTATGSSIGSRASPCSIATPSSPSSKKGSPKRT
jgi:hypothetical protein